MQTQKGFPLLEVAIVALLKPLTFISDHNTMFRYNIIRTLTRSCIVWSTSEYAAYEILIH